MVKLLIGTKGSGKTNTRDKLMQVKPDKKQIIIGNVKINSIVSLATLA